MQISANLGVKSNYLSSTTQPASSRDFLAASASSLLAASRTVFGADSTIFISMKKTVEEWLKTRAKPISVFYFSFATNVNHKIQTEIKTVYFEGKLMRILSEDDKNYITEEFVY